MIYEKIVFQINTYFRIHYNKIILLKVSAGREEGQLTVPNQNKTVFLNHFEDI